MNINPNMSMAPNPSILILAYLLDRGLRVLRAHYLASFTIFGVIQVRIAIHLLSRLSI